MTWIYNNTIIDDNEQIKDYEGFVYIIEHIETGKKYIGRKYFYSTRKLKSTDTRRTKVFSDWKKYNSSKPDLAALVKANPEEYVKKMLHLCKTQGEANYKEVMEIIKRDALARDDYLNDNLLGRYFKKNVKKYFSF